MGEGYEQVKNEGYGTLAEQMAVPGFGAAPAPGALTRCRSPGRQPRQRLVAAAEAGRRGRSLSTVVVLGATGMAGLLAGQNARLPGASRVIGAGRRPPVRAAAAGATAVAMSGDRDQDAALGRRGLHQDRADIAYVQAGAGRARCSGAGSVSLDFVLAQLPALMQLTAGGRV